MSEVVLIEEEYPLSDGERIRLIIYCDENCATFEHLDKRGRLKRSVAVPRHALVTAVNVLANQESEKLL